MQTDNQFLDDLAKVASGALGSVSGVKHEVEVRIQQQLERLLARMNLVPREEFDAMKAVAQAAREAQIKLEAQGCRVGSPPRRRGRHRGRERGRRARDKSPSLNGLRPAFLDSDSKFP